VGARVPGHERANCPTHHGERDGDLRVTTGGRRGGGRAERDDVPRRIRPPLADNETIGASAYLPEGSHESVRVPLNTTLENATEVTATVVADANRSGAFEASDGPYEVDGVPVADSATVLPSPEDSGNETTTTTRTRTETTSGLDVDESDLLTPNPANASNGGSSGGFVPLSPLTAVVALAAAALLGWRQ